MTPEEIEKYMPYMEKFDMTEKQKRKFIQTFWGLLKEQADKAWNKK